MLIKKNFSRMSWEVQFRKAESELELKLSSFQNLSPENDSVKLESEIEQLLIRLNKIMNDQEGQNPKMTGDFHKKYTQTEKKLYFSCSIT